MYKSYFTSSADFLRILGSQISPITTTLYKIIIIKQLNTQYNINMINILILKFVLLIIK
jgi:hypothetical protein